MLPWRWHQRQRTESASGFVAWPCFPCQGQCSRTKAPGREGLVLHSKQGGLARGRPSSMARGDSRPAAGPDRYGGEALDPSQNACFRVSRAPCPLIGGAGGACARGVTGHFWALRRRVAMAEDVVEETLKRIQSQRGVQGLIVVNPDGIPIRSTMDNTTTIKYVALLQHFIVRGRRIVRDIDPQNDLTFLRIRSKKNEIMVAPEKGYFMIVVQNPNE